MTTSPSERGTRLSSWKEIAAHFEVTPRSVQLWEKDRSLPVHRLGTGPRARVVAYTLELDEWSRGQTLSRRENSNTRPKERHALRWIVIAAAMVVPLIGLIGTTRRGEDVPGVPARLEIDPGELRAWDSHGRLIWRTTLPDVDTAEYEQERLHYGRRYLIEDIDRDGTTEVVFVVRHTDSQSTDEIVCWNENGTERWRISFDDVPIVNEPEGRRVFDPIYVAWLHGVVHARGTSYLIVHARSRPFYPTQLVLLDPSSGDRVGIYWHPGGFFDVRLHDVTGDGVRDILFGGVNNPGRTGFGFPAFGILEVPFRPHRNGHNPFGPENAMELSYLLLPLPDMAPYGAVVNKITVPRPDRIQLIVSPPNTTLYYSLDLSLELRDFAMTDNTKYEHDKLNSHPLLDDEIESWKRIQRFPTAPYGNSEETRKLFTVDR